MRKPNRFVEAFKKYIEMKGNPRQLTNIKYCGVQKYYPGDYEGIDYEWTCREVSAQTPYVTEDGYNTYEVYAIDDKLENIINKKKGYPSHSYREIHEVEYDGKKYYIFGESCDD